MIIIADDITGAAEIAGIAFQRGLAVKLSMGSAPTAAGAGEDCQVVATDTRSMTAVEAVGETRRLAGECGLGEGHAALFKKTDSALRGHVVAELAALMEAAGYARAVYLPANPSKGRIIRNGVYYIREENGTGEAATAVPIAETAFNRDPEFPARTSVLQERFPDAAAHHILMPDAESEQDIRRIVSTYDDGQTLFAGAADLFGQWMESRCRRLGAACSPGAPRPVHHIHGSDSTLILCGSTQSRPLSLGMAVAPMPLSVYDGGDDTGSWDCAAYQRPPHRLILTIPFSHRTGKTVAVHLRTMMARQAAALVAQHRPDQLIIEGGATAWATLQAIGWQQFIVERQVAAGVVQMRAEGGTLVTLKPGSYPWGGLF